MFDDYSKFRDIWPAETLGYLRLFNLAASYGPTRSIGRPTKFTGTSDNEREINNIRRKFRQFFISGISRWVRTVEVFSAGDWVLFVKICSCRED